MCCMYNVHILFYNITKSKLGIGNWDIFLTMTWIFWYRILANCCLLENDKQCAPNVNTDQKHFGEEEARSRDGDGNKG